MFKPTIKYFEEDLLSDSNYTYNSLQKNEYNATLYGAWSLVENKIHFLPSKYFSSEWKILDVLVKRC